MEYIFVLFNVTDSLENGFRFLPLVKKSLVTGKIFDSVQAAFPLFIFLTYANLIPPLLILPQSTGNGLSVKWPHSLLIKATFTHS